jgi:serine protease AprX
MSTMANRTRGAVPTRMAAAIAALSLLAMPVPAGAQGSGRTVLLTLTDGVSLTQLADTVGTLGGRVLATLELSDTLLVELPMGVGAPAGSAEIPDTPMKVNGARTYSTATEPTFLQTVGATGDSSVGEGVTVALLDTGVAEVAGLVHVENLAIPGVEKGTDGLGHGTFLAGIIGGREVGYRGVAPGATLVDIKVADNAGNTSLARVLAGLELVKQQQVDVLNVSLSTGSPLPPGFDPLTVALGRLWDSGVTVVVAAGNEGPKWGSVTSPGNDPRLITVGALDENGTAAPEDDSVAAFSSRGSNFSKAKPDLVAPGVSLVSTAAPGSAAVLENQDSVLADGLHMRGSGTSMSAAVVTGAVAAVLQQNRDLTPNGVKSLLTKTTSRSRDLESRDGAGSGALDLQTALANASSAPDDGDKVSPDQDAAPWGPSEADADAWADFAEAWAAGTDRAAVEAAWDRLSPRTRIWAARAWAMMVVASSLGEDDAEFKARAWAAHEWSAEPWLARAWAARAWAARAWADDEWLARAWAARAWADDEWLASAWDARAWAGADWAARAWAARAWAGADWSARAWAARAWANEDWSARAWAGPTWSARAWADFTWQARAWAARAWANDAWTFEK